MQRRQFLTSLALSGFVAGSAGAQTFGRLGARPRQGERAPVQINSGGFSVLVQHLVVNGAGGALRLDWAHGAPLYYEDRVNLSGAGALATVFRTPFRVRWAEARPVGHVTLIADAGLLVAEAEGVQPGAQVTLGAGDYAWDLPGRLTPGGGGAAGANAGGVRMERDGRLLINLPQFHAQV